MKNLQSTFAATLLVACALLPGTRSVAASPVVAKFASATSGQKVEIDGTSNLHSWSVEGHQIDGRAEFPGALDTESLSKAPWLASQTVNPRVTVKIPVRSLKSGHEAMDNNMYKAMHADRFGDVTFTLLKMWTAKPVDANTVMAHAAGKLTIAGTTRPVLMTVKVTRYDANHLQFEGHHRIDTTHYGVKPVKAMLGVLKTGKVVNVSFTWMAHRVK